MFEPQPKARADLQAGTLYAITGEAGWVYYGQITPEKRIGIFRRRDREPAEPSLVVTAPIMVVIWLNHPSVGRALRKGLWRKLGQLPLVADLVEPRPLVIWPVGTLQVKVIQTGAEEYSTFVDDPAIQNIELAACYEADYHFPERLTVEFGAEPGEWHVGGPIWRVRKVWEERARRSPERHQLPEGWVPTTRQ